METEPSKSSKRRPIQGQRVGEGFRGQCRVEGGVEDGDVWNVRELLRRRVQDGRLAGL